MAEVSGSASVSVKEIQLNEDIKKATISLCNQSNETGVLNRNVPNTIPARSFHIQDLLSSPASFAVPVNEYQLKTGSEPIQRMK